ncbi:MAG: hypothetical protein A2X64_05230 [Ignavibacteria bacterium GWF2_33_9]|nr:MAG: hypothetical protein A2X64_05230 [Ignavibacteria bacterium GWF2_33_9]
MKILSKQLFLTELNKFFGVDAEVYDSSYIWNIVNPKFKDYIVLNISTQNSASDKADAILINVQTNQGFFELHNCTDYQFVESDEIIFWVDEGSTISCAIISKQSRCSIFSNVKKELLDLDITELNANEILAAVQLSWINKL